MRRIPALCALAGIALPLAASPNGPPDRGDGAWRLPSGESASEYFDLLVRLDSGHRVFARFLVTNEGPGGGSAAAFGHVIRPDGTVLRGMDAFRRAAPEAQPDAPGSV